MRRTVVFMREGHKNLAKRSPCTDDNNVMQHCNVVPVLRFQTRVCQCSAVRLSASQSMDRGDGKLEGNSTRRLGSGLCQPVHGRIV
jgi:hypothetical protein